MLAAEHAQIGLMDRAIEGMNKAVQLAPSFMTAHLQLGLMHYSKGDIEAARLCSNSAEGKDSFFSASSCAGAYFDGASQSDTDGDGPTRDRRA